MKQAPFFALFLVLLTGILALGCSQSSGKEDDSLIKVKQAGALRIAMDPSYPPFSSLDSTGEVQGYDVDLSRELALRIGVKANFVGIDVTTVFDALIAKRVDVAISAVNPAWEYAKEIGFSRGYFNAGQVFVVRRNAQPEINPDEMLTATLGVELGSTGEMEARKLAQAKPGISLVSFDSLEAALAALSAQTVDAVLADRVTAAMLLQGQGDLKIAGKPLTYEPYVIAVRSSDRALLKEVDTILEAMEKDGFLAGLEKRWVGSES